MLGLLVGPAHVGGAAALDGRPRRSVVGQRGSRPRAGLAALFDDSSPGRGRRYAPPLWLGLGLWLLCSLHSTSQIVNTICSEKHFYFYTADPSSLNFTIDVQEASKVLLIDGCLQGVPSSKCSQ